MPGYGDRGSAAKPGDWTIEVYEDLAGRAPYATFVRRLDRYQQIVLDTAVRTVLARQGNDVCSSEWGKALGRGLYEFRVRQSLEAILRRAGLPDPGEPRSRSSVLLRVFFTVERDRVVLLLGGYDKGADSSSRRQGGEIAAARAVLSQHRRQSRR